MISAKREYETSLATGLQQDENGVDLSLLRENLLLTPTERMEKHRRALIQRNQVFDAGRALRPSRTDNGT